MLGGKSNCRFVNTMKMYGWIGGMATPILNLAND